MASEDATLRAHALAETLLDRYGVVTRGSVMNEGAPGGFALAYRVLSGFEDSGKARRGYFIETLGAAQFSTASTVDRLRTFVLDRTLDPPLEAITLAATDPANPYGAALAWPDPPRLSGPSDETGGRSGHRPGRKAGGLVVLVDGALAVYLERGGKTVLAFTEDPAVLDASAKSIAALVRRGALEKLTVESVNGSFVLGTPLGDALADAGFTANPRGLRLRS